MDIKYKNFSPTSGEDRRIRQFASEIFSNLTKPIKGALEIVKEGDLLFGDVEISGGRQKLDILASSTKLTNLLGELKDKLYNRFSSQASKKV